jgi:ribonuclease inhibitor
MRQVLLDGTKIDTELDLHRELARQLEFGQYYGNNLAALRDRLETDVERPVKLVWKDSQMSRDRLGEALFARVVKIFTDVAAQDAAYGWTDRFEFNLE